LNNTKPYVDNFIEKFRIPVTNKLAKAENLFNYDESRTVDQHGVKTTGLNIELKADRKYNIARSHLHNSPLRKAVALQSMFKDHKEALVGN